jgi:hypothetical protein
MGGRAAEEILFHEVTGGAANDFDAANRIATSMVTKWGMGRDPEATEGGVSGRGSLSFFVPTAGHSLPSEIQAASSRAIRSILDEAYAEASQTLIAHLETLRRLAAYLVEHERVDGATFDDLFDGRLAVPTAGEEWRAAASRPRAWGEVVDLAGHRTRNASRPVAVAVSATSTLEAAPAMTPAIAEPGEPSIAGNERPIVETLLADGGPLSAEASAAGAAPGADQAQPTSAATDLDQPPLPGVRRAFRRVRRPLGRRSASRRVRSVAAGWLRRAERWIGSGELEADRL